MTAPVVRFIATERRFGAVTAISGLHLDVPSSAITVLLGPNGAGKTTAMRLITGALTPSSGSVQVFGLDPTSAAGSEVRRRCGVVSAKPSLYDRLDGRDNLRYSAELFGLGRGSTTEHRIEEAAAQFGIADALNRQVGGYSTGMKTRLALARAVLHDPELLLLDEPTSGLDPESAAAVLELIRTMTTDGRSVILCTHLLSEAEGLADLAVVMEHGSLMVAGSPDDLAAQHWPQPLLRLSTGDPRQLDPMAHWPQVTGHKRTETGAEVTLVSDDVVPELIARLCADGVPLHAVEPYRPTLEDVYFAVRAAADNGAAVDADAAQQHELGNGRGTIRHRAEEERPPTDLRRTLTVARTDLKQLAQAKDFLFPMIGLGTVFFVLIPAILLLTITQIGSFEVISRVSDALEALPDSAESQIRGSTPQAQTGFALAVFLFAPVAVIVPLTISTAVGAATIVGERERGTGEFLAHSPASAREIYLGKLVASLVPGYATVIIGFAAYSLIVNLIVGPSVGGWFFPTAQWWIMILWVLPPFLAICLSLVLRLSARVSSTAAAQQASGLVSLPLIMVAYSQATGVLFGAGYVPYVVGAVAWLVAVFSLRRGMRAVRRDRLLSVASGM